MNASYSSLPNTTLNHTKPKHRTDAFPLLMNTHAPIAKSEIDDEADDREVITTPYPGVDDGFFNVTEKNDDKNKQNKPDVEKVNPNHPDVEVISTKPREPEPIEPIDDTPLIFDRFDPDETDNPDGTDNRRPDPTDGKRNDPTDGKPGDDEPSEPPLNRRRRPSFFSGFGHDLEVGSMPGDFPESIPDVNIYQHKKTLAQGMMDLALFSANANQLRYVLESYNRHPYFYPSIIFIAISLMLQVAVGIGLIWNATYNVKDQKEICIANKINNFTVIGIFLVTVVNVFISAFGVANPPA